jgi:glycosyltransferase involved in cell wall biosynthesis
MISPGPMLSVVMPVYNAERFLAQAIESILIQTFTDFELIIIDDGSTDKSAEIVLSIPDSRIRFFRNETNKGIVYSRNRGLQLCRGIYYAPFDADDIVLPEKFEKQVQILSAQSDVIMVGTWVQFMDENGNFTGKSWKLNAYPDLIKPIMLFRNYFAHSSVVIRRNCIPHTGYQAGLDIGEDYQLYIDMMASGNFVHVQEYLTLRRIHETNVSEQSRTKNQTFEAVILKNHFSGYGIMLDKSQIDLLIKLRHGKASFTSRDLKNLGSLLLYINNHNTLQEKFGKTFLHYAVMNRFIKSWGQIRWYHVWSYFPYFLKTLQLKDFIHLSKILRQ